MASKWPSGRSSCHGCHALSLDSTNPRHPGPVKRCQVCSLQLNFGAYDYAKCRAGPTKKKLRAPYQHNFSDRFRDLPPCYLGPRLVRKRGNPQGFGARVGLAEQSIVFVILSPLRFAVFGRPEQPLALAHADRESR